MSGPVTVITSCSARGWEEYGKRFVETFNQHWPREVALHVVSEDDLVSEVAGFCDERHLTFSRLWHISKPAHEFEQRHHNKQRSKGMAPDQKRRTKTGGYNFRYDAYRFSKKVFAIEAVARSLKTGRLFWVDGDVETFAPVGLDLLERMLPLNTAISCLDRGHYHSECGFVGYNLDHPQCKPFITAFAALYGSDEFQTLGEWHDSWVFDWLRRRMNVDTFAIPHNSRSHPFVNSELGNFMDHKKGPRKKLGTPAREVLNSSTRAIPYWQGNIR